MSITVNSDPDRTKMPTYESYDQILLFGDSITQGSANQESGFAFAAALQDDYVRRLDIINRGFSGYNTSQAMVVLPRIIPPTDRTRVRLMTIFFGANDAVLPPGSQHVSLEEYKSCLEQMISHPSVQAQGMKLLLITPPPINEYQLDTQQFVVEDGARRTAANTKLYAEGCREVGSNTGVPVVDIWSAFMQAAGWKESEPLAGSKTAAENKKLAALLSDGLHFNPPGYKIMYEEVSRAIASNYPELVPDSIPMNFPPWEDAPRQS